MIYDVRTARSVFCYRTITLPMEQRALCASWRCGVWRWVKETPTETTIDDNNCENLYGYCGAGGVPVSKAKLTHQK